MIDTRQVAMTKIDECRNAST